MVPPCKAHAVPCEGRIFLHILGVSHLTAYILLWFIQRYKFNVSHAMFDWI